ncbi:MAG TPA: heavy metal translocating P-type ATPase metal-binding domain-containing protein, partial [Chitinophagales bacterium]|nr:heavy metal translocating P-type ATPase metal-binding domain-containing protein [Chitinophagales bacterium]
MQEEIHFMPATLPIANTTVTCFHCGDACRVTDIVFEEKHFCCDGCKAVYDILNSNELCDYYTLTPHAGFTAKEENTSARYDFLDKPDIVEKILTFRSEELNVVQFYVPKIHCASCIWLLENMQKLVSGVSQSRVDFTNKEVTVQYNPTKASLRQIAETMDRIGYEPEFNLQMLEKKARSTYNRTILYKIGLVGFCFGNIMLLAFPEYFAGEGNFDPILRRGFSYLTMLLAMPVLFYGASEYFANTWKSLRDKRFSIDIPIAIGLLAMTFRSTVDILGDTGSGYFDSLAGLVFFLLLGRYLQDATYFHLSFDRTFKSYFPLSVRVKHGDSWEAIPVSNVVKGDKLLINPSELIPCDAFLLSNQASVDYSFVTGEAEPVHKTAAEMLYAGGRLRSTQAIVEVTRPVSQSYLTQLWNNRAFGKEQPSGYSELADTLSKYFTFFILTAAVATWAYWHFITLDAAKAVYTFTTVLIVACPCALAMTVPFVWGNTMRRMSKSGFYCKHTTVLEKMNRCNAVVFDKTGTLTGNVPQVTDYVGIKLSENELTAIGMLTSQSMHPLSRAVHKHIGHETTSGVTSFKETAGNGIEGIVDNVVYKIGSPTFVGWNRDLPNREACFSHVYIRINGECMGYFELTTVVRSGLRSMLSKLKTKFLLHLLSGDNGNDANRYAAVFGTHRLHYNQSPESKL